MSSSLVQHLVSFCIIHLAILTKLTRTLGHCSWEPPIGAFIVPRSADGEWWELADASRNNRSYYYSELRGCSAVVVSHADAALDTLTGKTQWTRPGGEAFVIPLGLIQVSEVAAFMSRC